MKNEFPADSTWDSPCTAMPGGCGSSPTTFSGTQVLEYYQMDLLDLSKVGREMAPGCPSPHSWSELMGRLCLARFPCCALGGKAVALGMMPSFRCRGKIHVSLEQLGLF